MEEEEEEEEEDDRDSPTFISNDVHVIEKNKYHFADLISTLFYWAEEEAEEEKEEEEEEEEEEEKALDNLEFKKIPKTNLGSSQPEKPLHSNWWLNLFSSLSFRG